MNELSFLIDLILNHKLSAPTRKAVAERIKVVEESWLLHPMVQTNAPRAAPAPLPTHIAMQSPSTQALMLKHGMATDPPHLHKTEYFPPQAEPAPAPMPVAVIAQTPAAVAALNSRQQAIADAVSGKPEKGRTSPRKY